MENKGIITSQEEYNGILLIRLVRKGDDLEVSVNSHDRSNDNKPLSTNDLFICYGTLGQVLMAECNKDPNDQCSMTEFIKSLMDGE